MVFLLTTYYTIKTKIKKLLLSIKGIIDMVNCESDRLRFPR